MKGPGRAPAAGRTARAGHVVLESLRLDLDPEEAVRERAETAIALGVGGFIVFGGERQQVADLVAHLRARAARPLWIGADLERGAGQQFAGLPTLPPPAGLAAHPEPEEAARLAGAITARGARSVGVDLVFAPVLDLDIEPDNPIVGTRSFGLDPVTVARLAGAWIEGCQQEGVVACAKHFPGHGRTTSDSHAEIPVVTTERGEFEADLLPFRRLAGRVGAMLTAHVAYPSLGVDGPATLSRALLVDLLRDNLEFTGLTVTDAMNMSGFLDAGLADEESDTADEGAAAPLDPAVAALLAGCDLLLYPEDLAATIDALERAAVRDARVAVRIEEATSRAADVRARFGGGKLGKLATATRAAARAGGRSDRATHAGAAERDVLEAAAISMLTIQRRGPLPEWLRAGRPIRVIAIWDDREMSGRPVFGTRFVEELRGAGWQAALAAQEDPPERIPSIVLIASTPQAWKGTAGLTPAAAARVERALANPSGALPVVFGHRRLLEKLGGTGICAWSTEPALELFAARKLVADAEAGEPEADAGSRA
jgi:beta-glucosidase